MKFQEKLLDSMGNISLYQKIKKFKSKKVNINEEFQLYFRNVKMNIERNISKETNAKNENN